MGFDATVIGEHPNLNVDRTEESADVLVINPLNFLLSHTVPDTFLVHHCVSEVSNSSCFCR